MPSWRLFLVFIQYFFVTLFVYASSVAALCFPGERYLCAMYESVHTAAV